MIQQRYSDDEVSKRDIPSFIEPRPPLIQNPFMRPRPQKGTNLLQFFEDSNNEELESPDSVQVYLRLKPCKIPNTLYEVRGDKYLVTSLDTTTAGHGRNTQHNVTKQYTFSKIFDTGSNQKEIFDEVVKENLKKLRDGQNFTLLTYGASGSGKTYTLMGTVKEPGLVPRSLEYVFRLVDAAQQPTFKPTENGFENLHYSQQDYELQWVNRLRRVSAPLRDKYRRMSVQLHGDLAASTIDLSNRTKHYVWVSFVEIYNEAIYDLLAPPDKRTKLQIRQDTSGHAYVKGANQAFVRSAEEAYDVLVAGKHNLVIAATGVHANSSRSHCIFTITLLTETVPEGEVRASCVRLCDLAGCERARATRNTGARMAESRAINSSLHVLDRCLRMLRRNQKQRHDAIVPYRQSKLTRLLGSGLSGVSGEAVSMVVTLNPSPEYTQENKHVLSLAAVTQDIQINATTFGSNLYLETMEDTTIGCSSEVMNLRAENERLHFELVQAQARNKELLVIKEEDQQKSADTMREVVEETRDIERQYYMAQLETLQSQMEEMKEEYEARLGQANIIISPSSCSQNKVADLMTEIAVLEEKLRIEREARLRAEKEVQRLLKCIEERDEHAFKETTPLQDAVCLLDNEYNSQDDIDDPLNESLEPVFRKDTTLAVNVRYSVNNSVHTEDNINGEPLSLDVSSGTLKNDDDSTTSHLIYNNTNECHEESENNSVDRVDEEKFENLDNSVETNEVHYTHEDNDLKIEGGSNDMIFNNKSIRSNKSDVQINNSVEDVKINYNEELENKLKKINTFRGTYFVKDQECRNEQKNINSCRGSYCFQNSENKINNRGLSQFFDSDKEFEEIKCSVCVSKVQKKEMAKTKSPQNCDLSLRRFEELELESKTCQNDKYNETLFGEIKMLKEKRNYFQDSVNKQNIQDVSTEYHNAEMSKDEFKQIDDVKLPSVFKDVVSDNIELGAIQTLLGDSTSKADMLFYFNNPKIIKKHESVDIFEEIDSPGPVKIKEIIDNKEIANRSMENLVLNQSTKKPLAQDHTQSVIKDIQDHPVLELIQQAIIEKDNYFDYILKDDPIKIKHEIEIQPSSSNEYVEKSINKEIANRSMENLVLNQSTKKPLAQEHTQSVIKDIQDHPVLELTQRAIIEKDNYFDYILKDDLIKIKHEIEIQPSSSDEYVEKSTTQVTMKLEPASSVDDSNGANKSQNLTKPNNTTEEFENICKDLTTSRSTEFELLVSQEINEHSTKISDKEIKKYNLRNKQSEKKPLKRNLRLRQKVDNNENLNLLHSEEGPKLSDIVNLQTQFCDLTMDKPTPITKPVKDIQSPEKYCDENLPPMMSTQSCPSKSVTRNRRKLFTPRAEPLDESVDQRGDSNERLHVPRPSYHRSRVRRKL